MAVPAWDAGFAASPAHGVTAQHVTLNAAVQRCRSRRVAVDVGAHIGTWAVELAAQFERVCAFEPVPENFRCLSANARLNTDCYEMVLGARTRSGVGMRRHGKNSGCWRVDGGGATPAGRLDDLTLEDVDLLKIDVEGYEGEVILGAVQTIARSFPVIVFEDNGLGQQLFGAAWRDPKPLLTVLGYRHAQRIAKDEIWTA